MKFIKLPKFYLKKLNSYPLISCENNCIRVDENNENPDLVNVLLLCLSFLLNIKNFLSTSLNLPTTVRSYVNQDCKLRYTSILATKQYH